MPNRAVAGSNWPGCDLAWPPRSVTVVVENAQDRHDDRDDEQQDDQVDDVRDGRGTPCSAKTRPGATSVGGRGRRRPADRCRRDDRALLGRRLPRRRRRRWRWRCRLGGRSRASRPSSGPWAMAGPSPRRADRAAVGAGSGVSGSHGIRRWGGSPGPFVLMSRMVRDANRPGIAEAVIGTPQTAGMMPP